jgi:hypothetical protein
MQTDLCQERLGVVTDKALMALEIQRAKLGQKYRLPCRIKIASPMNTIYCCDVNDVINYLFLSDVV